MNQIEQLNQWIRESNRIVFFGGAGVSTESHIPDFRSDNGLYKKKYPYPAETMLSHTFFVNHPKEFFDFYFNQMIYEDAVPNKAHYALSKLEQAGKLKAIVTQNIDGLHQKAGSLNVLELHGSVLRNYCTRCGKFFTLEETIKLRDQDGIPRCDVDGQIIKPDVVLYEEGLDQNILYQAIDQISKADLLIVGGTSLVVYPAAGLIQYFRGKHLVLINKEVTPMDAQADLVIHEPIGEVLDQAVKNL
ncbi:NAD-dependent protein deacylase [Dubosiella newyorkensis]|jgi:NAD-dependent deacetylase|uniref:NAD-dependent protein deacetylase n=1 Tax=Dubosiella newyorkensis TaxID=1862672 RepID=A0A1U7NK12_9FIRM|nr:NAD-dependent protein deacylase [Dubosiella newyorkensis]MCI9041348.1 NAD-dependent protein deacylase [Dubosiella newyorkensis]OLU44148.1 NAD-dependent protein deacylase [Dubosiella newyorkensis]